MCGVRTIDSSPSTAMTTKYTSITGPKNRPTLVVPLDWIENSATRMTTLIGSTSAAKPGATTATPSTADSTEIAGVTAPSP